MRVFVPLLRKELDVPENIIRSGILEIAQFRGLIGYTTETLPDANPTVERLTLKIKRTDGGGYIAVLEASK